MDNDLTIRLRENMISDSWELYGFTRSFDPKIKFVAEPLALTETRECSFAVPFARISKESAQALFDDLWLGGVRPSSKLKDHVPHEHLVGEVNWNRHIIEKLLNDLWKVGK